LFSLCWLVEGERGKGRENAFTPPPQQKGSWMEFPMPDGGEWERGKGQEQSCPLRERKMRTFEIHEASFLGLLKASTQVPLTCFHQTVAEYSVFQVICSPKGQSLPHQHKDF
jgi:hypothetical protein